MTKDLPLQPCAAGRLRQNIAEASHGSNAQHLNILIELVGQARFVLIVELNAWD